MVIDGESKARHGKAQLRLHTFTFLCEAGVSTGTLGRLQYGYRYVV